MTRLSDAFYFPTLYRYSQTNLLGIIKTGVITHHIAIGFEAGWVTQSSEGPGGYAPNVSVLNPIVGTDFTEASAAAERLSEEGIDAEVIDVVTLKPLDSATILDSVARTGRLVIVHEAPLTGGFGAEIAARVAGTGLMSLLAPIERVAGYDTVMPYPRTEAYYMPSIDRVMAAARRVMTYQ